MTMLERVARAIATEYHKGCGFPPCEAVAETDEHWPDWIGEARAALMAIREADEQAIEAGMTAEAPGQGTMASILEYDNRGADSLAASFTAMIDAILSEGEKT